ncbi:unnamed protein product [Rangifer tarandus platyrhynchus]|uniref:Secreted protein n=1 Tax=Rangifer tarandus platyrhynchus TaxID=3082113 RepID=A0ABN8YQ08_RANTA|nr:unnamed protein product [Rangifer tarandus platyrhynchus]
MSRISRRAVIAQGIAAVIFLTSQWKCLASSWQKMGGHGVGVPLERSRVRRRNAILRLFAQHPVGFPQRTMASREPVLSNLTEGYCAALIPPLIILKAVKL